MDLHLTADQASPEEQAAIDAALEGLESSLRAATPLDATDGHAASNGFLPRSKRSLLLPVLHTIQERIGWISPGALRRRTNKEIGEIIFLGTVEFKNCAAPRPAIGTAAATTSRLVKVVETT